MRAGNLDVRALLAELDIPIARDNDVEIWARCPYHSDHNPSWHIHAIGDRVGLHHCFSCGAGGDWISLVQHVLQFHSRQSARAWADEHPSMWQLPGVEPVQLRVVNHSAFALPREVVHIGQPELWPSAASAYLRSRAIEDSTVRVWGWGVALVGRLAGRIVMPVFDDRQMLVSYCARSFWGDKLRYLNPKREENADRDAVFGGQLWPDLSDRDTLWLTEGLLDAVSLWQAGVAPVGALLGSQLSDRKVDQLRTFRRVVHICDPDVAGGALARSLLGLADLKLVSVRLPDTLDANKLLVCGDLRRWLGECVGSLGCIGGTRAMR